MYASKSKEVQRDRYRFPSIQITIPRFITNWRSTVETVTSFKLLGVHISSDVSWNLHCEYIIKKANKRLYILRLLRKARVERPQLVLVYGCLVRPILQYAIPAWSAIPDYLSVKIERVQKRAMKIIYPGTSYEESLIRAGLETLVMRRDDVYKKLIYVRNLQKPIN